MRTETKSVLNRSAIEKGGREDTPPSPTHHQCFSDDMYVTLLLGYSLHSLSYLALSLTGEGPFGPSLPFMQISLKVLKLRYRRKLGIPQAGSYACIEITTVPILYLISL